MLLLQNSRACYKIHIASFSTSDTCNITGDAKLYIPIGGTASLAFWTCYKAFFCSGSHAKLTVFYVAYTVIKTQRKTSVLLSLWWKMWDKILFVVYVVLVTLGWKVLVCSRSLDFWNFTNMVSSWIFIVFNSYSLKYVSYHGFQHTCYFLLQLVKSA